MLLEENAATEKKIENNKADYKKKTRKWQKWTVI